MHSFIFALLILGSLNTFAQEIERIPIIGDTQLTPFKDSVYITVDEEAKFPGGRAELMKYFSKQLKYPEDCLNDGIGSDKIILEYIIDEEGIISDLKIVAGFENCEEFVKASIEIFQKMPRWIPAIKDGEKVKSRYRIPLQICVR